MKAVIYRRVSTDEQSISGLGLEAQEAACRAWAAREGAEVVAGPYTDGGLSGAKGIAERPGLAAALARLEPGDVFLVAKRDRLGRDTDVCSMVERTVKAHKARVVSAAGEGSGGDAPDEVLLRGIIDLFSQNERLVIRSRTIAALAAKRARGERTGGVPYGWTEDEAGPVHPVSGKPLRLKAEPVEAERLGMMAALRKAGASYRTITRRLNDLNVPTKKGVGPWRPGSVAKILKAAGGRVSP